MNEKNALNILNKYITDKRIFNKILNHSTTVKLISVRIANAINRNKKFLEKHEKLDINKIKIASLLHDIGRIKYPPKTELSIRHNIAGAEIINEEIKILKKKIKTNPKNIEKLEENLDILKFCKKVCLNHIGIGLTKEDIIKHKINLPPKNYLPKTLEEKIIAYSDNLVFGSKIRDINYVIERFGNWLGKDYQIRIIKLHKKLHKLMNENEKIKIDKNTLKIISGIIF